MILIFFKKQNRYVNAGLGFIAGDVLGLPYEFQDKKELTYKGLMGYGTHNQPLGTWSDDTTFLYCFLASLGENNEFDIEKYKHSLVKWVYEGEYTYNNKLPFDIGRQTSKAITNLKLEKEYFRLNDEKFNGNVALLRIFSYALYLKYKQIKPTVENIKEFVSITNPHFISLMCCYYYALMIWYCDSKLTKKEIMRLVIHDFSNVLNDEEKIFFKTLFYPGNLEGEIENKGYILDTLNIVVYQFVKKYSSLEESLKDTILFGGDTDSNAALVGGLNGFYFNQTVIWKSKIINIQPIEYLLKLNFISK